MLIMKKYRYVEFVDGCWGSTTKTGNLYIVAVSEEKEFLIKEFSLMQNARGHYTTLKKIGELGWELAFVTPCGSMDDRHGQMIQNAYVFKKEEE